MSVRTFSFLTLGPLILMGCEAVVFEGTTGYRGPDSYIAIAQDRGRDSSPNANDTAAVAVTPDGCQTWYIDDGLEARASNRLDPVSGLPVCGGEPGVVYGPYQSGTPGIRDRVPGTPAPVAGVEEVEIRPTGGHGHPTEQPTH